MLDKAMDKLATQIPSMNENTLLPPVHQTIPRQPLLSLGKPPGRIECQILSQWITSKLSEKPNKNEEGLERLVYEFALLELIRQISVQCAERGVLFKKMMNGVKKTYENDIEILQIKKLEEQADLRIQCSTLSEELKVKIAECNTV